MFFNSKLNDTARNILWAKEVHMCEHVRNSMATTSSTKIPFGIFYGEKSKINGSFSEFGCIEYVPKRENIKGEMKDKMYKEIMVGYTKNYIRDTYRLYNPETKSFIMSRDIEYE